MRAPARAWLAREGGDIAEAVVEQHGGVVHEVADHDLTRLPRSRLTTVSGENPQVADVLVQVEAGALLAEVTDLERLDRAVARHHHRPELVLDLVAPLLR